jgi:hypothetical protein
MKKEKILKMSPSMDRKNGKEEAMSQQDLYGELSKKVGSEHSRIVPEIWKTVCTLEEAEILNVLPATLEELVQRFGTPQKETSAA